MKALKRVDFLYDFASPNCYVAFAKLNDLRRKRIVEDLKFRPILLGGVFKSTGDGPLPKGSLEYKRATNNSSHLRLEAFDRPR